MGKAGKARKHKRLAELAQLAQTKISNNKQDGSTVRGTLSASDAAITCRTLKRLLASSSLRSSTLAKPIRRSVFAWPEMTAAELAGVSSIQSHNPNQQQEQQQKEEQAEEAADLDDDEAMQLTSDTLDRLVSDSSLLYSEESACVRLAVSSLQPLLGANAKHHGASRSNVGDALHECLWEEAEVQLRHMRDNNKLPRLGALQRWIRDLFIPGTADIATAARLLTEVLFTCGQIPYAADKCDNELPGPMQVHPMWTGHFGECNGSIDIGNKTDVVTEATAHKVVVLSEEQSWKGGMQVWGCVDRSAMASFCRRDVDNNNSISQHADVTRIAVPFVPNSFILNNVLSPSECQNIINIATTMGFTPEAAYSLSGIKSPSAAGCVWAVRDSVSRALFERVRALLPQSLGPGPGYELAGLNVRWRVYKYDVGAVYRPHIDGAWAGSSLTDDDAGELKFVPDAYQGVQRSRMTFLVYLNDDFEGGGTTFYAPSVKPGCAVARSVAPKRGSVLCFPHGEHVEHVGLVHEGSAVTTGSKYVVRTEVMYTLPTEVVGGVDER